MEYAGSTPSKHFRAMTAPVAGTIFAVTLAFMLLFPFVRLTLGGAGEPETLLFLAKTDFGLNIFALVLLLVPVVGVGVSVFLPERRAVLIDAILAIIGVVMIPLAMLAVGHDAGRNAALGSHVAPGVGMFFITIMLLVLAVSSSIAVLQNRR